jgi:CubicO group peptidase (beta-lactamase class C family)
LHRFTQAGLKLSAVIIAILFIVSCSTVNNALHTATGFSAKNICSGHFVSGFSQQQIMQQALIPISQTFRLVDVSIDQEQQWVDTEILLSHSRRAVYKDGFGCILLPPGEKQLSFKLPAKRTNGLYHNQDSKLEWPLGLAAIATNELTSRQKSISHIVEDHFHLSKQDPDLRTKALLVIHKGKLIAEHYAEGVDLSTPLLSWSMAKSITNLQVGLLVKQGQLSLHNPVDVPGWDNEKYQHINLDNLLTMTSGLEFDETYGIGGDAALMLSVVPDVDVFARSKPVIHPAGEHWYYSSGTTNIISGVIRRSFGVDSQGYLNFTYDNLFKPLGIDSAVLEMDSAGNFIGSSYMYASARDWAKIGQMLLQNGSWNGETILPSNWIEYSKIPTPANTSNRYGAHFWLNRNPKNANQKRFWPEIPEDAFYMSGFQGQRVVMIPSKQLVFVRLGYTTPKYSTKLDVLMKNVITALESD